MKIKFKEIGYFLCTYILPGMCLFFFSVSSSTFYSNLPNRLCIYSNGTQSRRCGPTNGREEGGY